MDNDNKLVDELADKIAQAVKTGIKDEIINGDEITEQEQIIIELDDEDLDSGLEGLILDPAELEQANEQILETNVSPIGDVEQSTNLEINEDQEIEYIEYVQKDRTSTLTRKSLIYELTDLTMVKKKFHKRSVVEGKADLSITLASDKGLTREFIDDLILKLTS